MTMTAEEKEKLNTALQTLTAEYYKTMILILAAMGDLDNLNYVRTLVHTPDEGKYLISFLHVGGPLISLKTLREGKETSINLEKPIITST